VGPFASVFGTVAVKVSADPANDRQSSPSSAGFIDLADKNRKAMQSNQAECIT
jgi:hypothetical protein